MMKTAPVFTEKFPVNVEPIETLSELELAFVGGGVGEATFG
jgi:hypothetical protein